MPGYVGEDFHCVKNNLSEFYCVSVDFNNRHAAVSVAERLANEYGVKMIELCGGLANCDLVAKVKQAVGDGVSVGQVMYGPEYRKTLVKYLRL